MANRDNLSDEEKQLRSDVDTLMQQVKELISPAAAPVSVDPAQFQELVHWVDALKVRGFTSDEIAGRAEAILAAVAAAQTSNQTAAG